MNENSKKSKEPNPETTSKDNMKIPFLLIIIFVSIFACIFYLLINFYTNPTDFKSLIVSGDEAYKLKHGDLGTLGDFIGGLLNPIATSITIALLIYTIFQNNKTIRINSEELSQTRDEIEQSRIAHQKLADTESKNLENSILLTSQKLYEKEIETITSEIENILDLKLITSLNHGSIHNFNIYFSDYQPIVLYEEHENAIPVTLLEKSISLAIALCKTVSDESNLDKNPNKDSIIWMQKTRITTLLFKLNKLAKSISVYTPEDTDIETTLTTYDEEIRGLVNQLALEMTNSGITPLMPMAREKNRNTKVDKLLQQS